MIQLRSTISLLATAANRFTTASLEGNEESSVYHSAVTIVGQRISSIIDEIINVTSLNYVDNISDQENFEAAIGSAFSTLEGKNKLEKCLLSGGNNSSVDHRQRLEQRLFHRRQRLSDSTAVISRTLYSSFDISNPSTL